MTRSYRSHKENLTSIFIVILLNKLKKRNLKSVYAFTNDLFKSALLTIGTYYLMMYVFYMLLLSNGLNDPSQSLNNKTIEQICTFSIGDKGNNENMVLLSTLVSDVLNKTNDKYFLCYRSLFSLLKLYPNFHNFDNQLDVCLYESDLNSISIVKNLANQFGYSTIETQLRLYKKKYPYLRYEYNKIFGYYHISHLDANVYIYLFIYSKASSLEFETIRRHGYFYLQFGYLINLFKDKYNLNGKHDSLFSESKYLPNTIDMLNKLPIYMIDDMYYKTKIANNYFYIPFDPYEVLMHLYPGLWWITNEKCFI